MTSIEAIGVRAGDDASVDASEEDIDAARGKVLEDRLKDHRHPLTNAEFCAIKSELREIRQRRDARAYAVTKGGGGDTGDAPKSLAPMGGLGVATLLAVQSGVLLQGDPVPRDPAAMSPAQLVDAIANLKSGIAAFKPPLSPPKEATERLAVLEKELARRNIGGPPVVPLERLRSSAELEGAILREQAFLASPLARIVSYDERKAHERYLAELEGAARVVRTPASAAKPETPKAIMSEIDRLRGVLAKAHDASLDVPVRTRIAELERQWVATARANGLAPAPHGIEPETASDEALKTEVTWLAGGGAVPMHVQMTQGADAYRQRLQEEALLRKPGGLEILLRIHAGDPVAQMRLVTHAIQRAGGDATSRPGENVHSLLFRYYATIGAQARAGNAAVRAMPTMGDHGLVFPSAEDARRYDVAQRALAMNPGTTLGSIAASLCAMNGGTLAEIRAAGEAGNVVEGAGGGVAPALGAGRGRGVHYDTTQKPQVGVVQPSAPRPAAPTARGATPAPAPAGANGNGARVAAPPLVVPAGTRLPIATRDGNMTIVVPRAGVAAAATPAAPAPPKPAVPTTSGMSVHAPPQAEPPAAVAPFGNARTLASTHVGRPLDPSALPPGYTTYRLGDGSLGIRRKSGNAQDTAFAPLHVDEKGIVRFGEKRWADDRVIPKGTSLADAHAFMTGDEVPSFRAYARMLVENGIASEAEIQAALAKNGFEGRKVEDVRHELKEAFRGRVMARMTLRDGDAKALDDARARYPELPWTTQPQAAKAEARHREMIRLTTGLNSSDIGSLAEEWYCEISGLAAAAMHVRVDDGTLGKQGIAFAESRHLDVLHGDTVYEIKRVSGELGDHDKQQFKDLRKLANAARPVDIGGGRIVREVRYTFVDPRGAKANEAWIKKVLTDNKNLSVEVFNSRGESLTVRKADVAQNPNVISDWLSR